MAKRSKVFVSYSHRDTAWLERLQVHLKPLVRSGAIQLWDDTRIKDGDVWRSEIEKALDETRVAILLISADFMASDFIAKEELPPLLAATDGKEVAVIPVILSDSFLPPQLSRFQSANPPTEPLIGMPKVDQEALLSSVARSVAEILDPSAPVPEPDPGRDEGRVERPRRVSDAEVAARVDVVRDVVGAALSTERNTYVGLIGVAALVVLVSLGRLSFSEPAAGQQTVLFTSALGGLGAAVGFLGGLLRVNARTLSFAREQVAAPQGAL